MQPKMTLPALMLALLAGPVQAQQWNQLAYYITYIGPEDMRSSTGQAVTTLGGMLQQDRANFHRFGLRHMQDGGDPLFADPGLRGRIPAMLAAGGQDRGRFAQLALSRAPFFVGVFVCGYDHTPSVILLAGAGEDHSGCF